MTLFAAEAIAETPNWMRAHATLSVPDALVPTPDPAVVKALQERAMEWSQRAEWERDQRVRHYLLEDRALSGEVLRRWRMQTTPAAAWWWMRTTTVPAGHRLVLTEASKPDRAEPGCDVCSESRPSLAYDAHRKHEEAGS